MTQQLDESVVDTAAWVREVAPFPLSYTRKDVLTYAVGIGCSEMQFIYERSSPRVGFEDRDRFTMFPTFPLSLTFKGASSDLHDMPSPAMQAFGIGAGMLFYDPKTLGARSSLDAERYIERVADLPLDCPPGLHMRARHVGIHKRGSGALSESECEIADGSGKVYYKLQHSAFAIGVKRPFADSGASLSPPAAAVTPPDRAPDRVISQPVAENQNAVYRLTGDFNDVHIDPFVASKLGYARPILHGMCTTGIVARGLLAAFAANDASCFKAMRVRLSSPVLPGDTLTTHAWYEPPVGAGAGVHGGGRVLFRTLVGDRVVINNAFIELTASPSPKEKELARL